MKGAYDVVIVGGGVMGCAIAFSLTTADPTVSVAVVERDPTYEFASTPRSVGNVRIQFSLEENVRVSRYALEVLDNFENAMAVGDDRPAARFRREGNLFLVSSQAGPAARRALDLQQSLGCHVSWWSPQEIRDRYPMYRAEGLAGATFSPRDGHADAYAVLMAYRAKARAQGASFLKGEGVEVLTADGRVNGVRLASGETLRSGCVVNSAGAWAARVARTAGVRLPIQPVQRQVFVASARIRPATPFPLTVLPSGLYFRTEGESQVLVGRSFETDAVGFGFEYDRNRFLERLWPELAQFVPAYDELRLVRGWSGLYAVNTLDGNAILGEWPDLPGLFFASGFSGHGFQQAPAVGRYTAELILGRPHALDLGRLHARRILLGKPLSEDGLV